MARTPLEVSATSETLSHCPYCALNCGLVLQTDNDAVIKTTRWKQSPLTAGALCTKGVHAYKQIAHSDRLTRPLVKRGKDFVEVEWDEALDVAAAGWLRIAEQSGPQANAVLSGGSLTNEKVYVIGKLARLAMGTPHVDYNGRFCMVAAGTAHKRAFGADRMMTPFSELDNADLAVVVGANLSDAFPVVIPQALERLRRRGGRVIVIDPRGSRFVRSGDLHLAVRPGTDAMVFNGILRAIDRAGQVDCAFVRDRTVGFDQAVLYSQPFTPQVVAELADINVDDFTTAAQLIGESERCMYLHGRGPEQQIEGTQNVASIINVGLARGHVGKPGCGINMLTGQRNGQGAREWGQRCNQLPAGRDIEDDNDRAVVAQRWGVEATDLPRAGKIYVELLQMAARGEIRGLLGICTNMSVSSPDLTSTDAQMRALEHVVMIDPFFSRSCEHADVVLPGSVWAEEHGTITTIEGRVVRVDKATNAVSGKSDLEILRALATRLGAAEHFDFEDEEAVFEEMRTVSAGGPNDYSGMSWDRIRDSGGLFWPCPDVDHPGTPQLYTERFLHDDGRARFQAVSPKGPPLLADSRYPLVLTTGRVLAQFLSGNQTMRIDDHQRRAPEAVLEVHPQTAQALGLRGGDRAKITSRQGTSTVAWTANEELRGDTVFLPYHWPACNRLVSAQLDPESGIPGFKYTPVQVERAPASVVVATPASTAAYPVNLDLAGRRVLVVGGGNVASRKIRAMLANGAFVTVVAPKVSGEIWARAARNVADVRAGHLRVVARPYVATDLEGVWLVMACADDPSVNHQVFVDAEERRVWCNSADDPQNCAWTLPSVARQGDLQITVSTNGRSPALSMWLRKRFEERFDSRWAGLVDVLSDVRRDAQRELGTSEVAGWLEGLDSGAFELAMQGDIEAARQHLRHALGLARSGPSEPIRVRP